MRVSSFNYELPPERIAQAPVEPRHDARLLVHRIPEGSSSHARVLDLPEHLGSGDLLVVNDTRVRSARLCGRRASGGAAELLLLEQLPDGERHWRAMARPAGKLKAGEILSLEGGGLEARLLERRIDPDGKPTGEWRLALRDPGGSDLSDADLIESHGRMPLPPYVKRSSGEDPRRASDRDWYQTIFARELGAVAAPTAGLHFTDRLLRLLEARGVGLATVTLHVGEGTFRPVTVTDTDQHRMHSERYHLSEETARAVETTRRQGGRVVAVGTTSLRVLESCADAEGRLHPGSGETSLFIVPGVGFKVTDALLTNFHLPSSTLLMLVAAFAGLERILALYREAVSRRYRFYSYGDATLLLRR